MSTQDDIKGVYRHYKGGEYDVLGIGKHSETLEDFVVYKPRYEEPIAEFFMRPKDMFFKDVVIEGKSMRRFTKIS